MQMSCETSYDARRQYRSVCLNCRKGMQLRTIKDAAAMSAFLPTKSCRQYRRLCSFDCMTEYIGRRAKKFVDKHGNYWAYHADGGLFMYDTTDAHWYLDHKNTRGEDVQKTIMQNRLVEIPYPHLIFLLVTGDTSIELGTLYRSPDPNNLGDELTIWQRGASMTYL